MSIAFRPASDARIEAARQADHRQRRPPGRPEHLEPVVVFDVFQATLPWGATWSSASPTTFGWPKELGSLMASRRAVL